MAKHLRQPNFVVVGAAKAGTTSLHVWLKRHPDVFLPFQKELHFFSAKWLRENSKGPGDARALQDIPATWEEYLAHYSDAGNAAAVGDVSPSYFSWWPSLDSIRERLGCPRIIVLLREPAEKAFSQYMHLVRDGRENLSFRAGLDAEDDRVQKGYGALWRYRRSVLYAEPVMRLIEAFGRDHVKVVMFEDLVRDPHNILRELFVFLGVNPEVRLDVGDVHNRSGSPKSRLLAKVLNRPELRAAARRVLPTSLVTGVGSALTSINTGAKLVLDPRDAERVRLAARDDRRRLAEMLGRQPPWPP